MKRGPGVQVKKLKDKKLRGKLKHAEAVYKQAQAQAIKANEWLLPAEAGYLEAEGEQRHRWWMRARCVSGVLLTPRGRIARAGVERTWNVKQSDLLGAVEAGAARKVLDLRLTELGPYRVNFTRAGRHAVLAGARGHLAVVDWQAAQLVCEVQVRETTRDVTFLHNEVFFAAAQKKCAGRTQQPRRPPATLLGATLTPSKSCVNNHVLRRYVYIYDKRGVEIHCLRDHLEPHALEFLPHHFLLASIGASGASARACAHTAREWRSPRALSRRTWRVLTAPLRGARLRAQACCTTRTRASGTWWRATPRGWGPARCCGKTRGTPCWAARTRAASSPCGRPTSPRPSSRCCATGGPSRRWRSTPRGTTWSRQVRPPTCTPGRAALPSCVLLPRAQRLAPSGSYSSDGRLTARRTGRVRFGAAGADNQVKVWDVRTFKPLHGYFSYSPASQLGVSQRGVLAVGYGSKVQVSQWEALERNERAQRAREWPAACCGGWRSRCWCAHDVGARAQLWKDALRDKAQSPYMTHKLYEGDHLSDLRFVNYEDVLGVGTSNGFSTILVPGALARTRTRPWSPLRLVSPAAIKPLLSCVWAPPTPIPCRRRRAQL